MNRAEEGVRARASGSSVSRTETASVGAMSRGACTSLFLPFASVGGAFRAGMGGSLDLDGLLCRRYIHALQRNLEEESWGFEDDAYYLSSDAAAALTAFVRALWEEDRELARVTVESILRHHESVSQVDQPRLFDPDTIEDGPRGEP